MKTNEFLSDPRAGMGIEEALEVLKQYHEDIDAGLEPTGRNLGNFGFYSAWCFISSDIYSTNATVNGEMFVCTALLHRDLSLSLWRCILIRQ